ncbi:major facilitator superfamily protein [Xanthomonas citri pv. aurantifolii str. ICPB 10535]|nr:major facilitator superfamily protein [Xanthomonas citri pv. aurantifolii str. ICPB 10535]
MRGGWVEGDVGAAGGLGVALTGGWLPRAGAGPASASARGAPSWRAIIVFTLGSLLCAAAQHLPQLVAARVVQGIGGAMLLPVGRLAVLKTVARADFLRAMSFIAIPALIGPLIGPTLGGWLVEVASWHWVFLINLPIGAIGFIAALPRTAASPR